MRQANRERFVIVQIEDPEPMADLEQIAQLEGIDMLFFGPGDFSQGIGDPGNFDNPRLDRGAPPDCGDGASPRQVRRHGGLVSTRWRQRSPWATSFINVGADVPGADAILQRISQAFAAVADHTAGQ